jgi:hypothetical protein
MSFNYKYPITSGYTTVNNGTQTNAVLAAPGANKLYRVTGGIVIVQVAAAGGGGIVSLQDGSTNVLRWDANSLASFLFAFTEIGLAFGTNNAINIVVSGAATQATVYCALTGYIVQ